MAMPKGQKVWPWNSKYLVLLSTLNKGRNYNDFLCLYLSEWILVFSNQHIRHQFSCFWIISVALWNILWCTSQWSCQLFLHLTWVFKGKLPILFHLRNLLSFIFLSSTTLLFFDVKITVLEALNSLTTRGSLKR